jgi:GNAT superfamily N-acetyltransferase
VHPASVTAPPAAVPVRTVPVRTVPPAAVPVGAVVVVAVVAAAAGAQPGADEDAGQRPERAGADPGQHDPEGDPEVVVGRARGRGGLHGGEPGRSARPRTGAAERTGRIARMRTEVSPIVAVDEELRSRLLDLWTDVSNAGGAVGFVAPVTPEDVAPVLDSVVDRVNQGRDVVALLRVDGEVAGFAVLSLSLSPLRTHWASVFRVQVHPSRQGAGLGTVLMTGVHDIARACGLEFLHLTVRGGTGIERFYAGFGYREFGRMPGAIRVAPGDDREEIHLTCPL